MNTLFYLHIAQVPCGGENVNKITYCETMEYTHFVQNHRPWRICYTTANAKLEPIEIAK